MFKYRLKNSDNYRLVIWYCGIAKKNQTADSCYLLQISPLRIVSQPVVYS